METKRAIWVGEGKSISQVDELFRLCGDEGCKQIEAVAIDQSAGFATCVKKHCPKALVVYDLFHIIYNYSRLVISAIRIRLSSDKKIKDDKEGYRLLKNSRFLLLTRNSRLPLKGKRSLITSLIITMIYTQLMSSRSFYLTYLIPVQKMKQKGYGMNSMSLQLALKLRVAKKQLDCVCEILEFRNFGFGRELVAMTGIEPVTSAL